MTRQRGFTMIEILIALAVASLLTVFVLSVTRSQLISYEMQSTVTSAQQNVRESFDFVEGLLRRACSGISRGYVRVYVSDSVHYNTTCFNVYDGATIPSGAGPGLNTAGSFTGSAPTTNSDAVEIIYGDGSTLTSVQTFTSNNVVRIGDFTNYVNFHTQSEPWVILTDSNFSMAYLVKVTNEAQDTGGVTTQAPTGTLTLSTTQVTGSGNTGDGLVTAAYVMQARTVALYVDTSDSRNPVLMLDPDGVVGSDHSDAQPLAEGVDDFQLAIGFDGAGSNAIDGAIADASNGTDEWLGNYGTTEISGMTQPDTSTNWATTSTTIAHPIQVRATVTVRTLNQYVGTFNPLAPAENRATSSWPYTSASTVGPRLRQLRMVVAPRAWNTTE